MNKPGEVPSGIKMMLKALGIEIDPAMFKTMAEAVTEIRDRLRRIEEKVDKLAAGGIEIDLPDASPTSITIQRKEQTNNAADRNGKEVAGRVKG